VLQDLKVLEDQMVQPVLQDPKEQQERPDLKVLKEYEGPRVSRVRLVLPDLKVTLEKQDHRV
jgi:hypothetical protein